MKKIHLIDDDEDDRIFFVEALEIAAPHISCHSFENSKEVLHDLEHTKKADLPDLIFLDINMPHMDGWQTLQHLKESNKLKHIPVIMYSTSSRQEDIDRSIKLGALCFFTKPFDFKELTRCLGLVALHLVNGTLYKLANISPAFAAEV